MRKDSKEVLVAVVDCCELKLEQENFGEDAAGCENIKLLEDVSTSSAHVYAGDYGIHQRPCTLLLLLPVSELGG